LAAVRACRACEAHLPLGPRPVLRAAATARILIVGQAPGARVNSTARRKPSLAETRNAWADYYPTCIPLPHPSPRNTRWLQRHAGFEQHL